MHKIFCRNRWDEASWPSLDHCHPQCMKLTKSATHIHLSVFVSPFYNVCSVFSEGGPSALVAYNPQVSITFLIIFDIEWKISIFTDPFVIYGIFFVLFFLIDHFHIHSLLLWVPLYVLLFHYVALFVRVAVGLGMSLRLVMLFVISYFFSIVFVVWHDKIYALINIIS